MKDSVKLHWAEIDGYFKSLQKFTELTAQSIARMRFVEALEYLRIQGQMMKAFVRKLEDLSNDF